MKVTFGVAVAASRQKRVQYVFALRDLFYKRMDMPVLVWVDYTGLIFKVIQH